MITNPFTRSALHDHAEPAQRLLGVAQLAPDSDELARLLSADPAPEVRAAAAQRCADLATLAAVWEKEADPMVRVALAAALGDALAATQDSAGARTLLEAEHCTDAIRAEVARRTQDAERRRVAIAGIRAEEPLIELALIAGHAETRLAAAERVASPEGLRKLAEAAKNRDHGVARPTLGEGLEEAREVMESLEELGIPMAEVTRKLQEEAVRLFVEPFDKLLAAIAAQTAATPRPA